MNKILDIILFITLLLISISIGYYGHDYINKNKQNHEIIFKYHPEKTKWNIELINGKWISDNDQYETLLILDNNKYNLVMINKNNNNLRMFSKGSFKIIDQTIFFNPDIKAKHPKDDNKENIYSRLAKNEFHADIGFHKNTMIWSVKKIFMSAYMIENKKFPAHPYFRYTNSNNVRWEKL